MFKEALQELVEGTEGGLAGLLMDSSGIALESYAKDDSPFDINTIGIEFSVVIGSIKRASEMLEAGAANEIAVGTDRLVTIIRTLGDTYFLALAMKPDGNFGKGRYLMRTCAPKLMAELLKKKPRAAPGSSLPTLRVLVLSGPNLQLLGTREPAIYGTETLADIHARLADRGAELGATIKGFQSNHEGALLDVMGDARGRFDGLLLNGGALTHTSLALFDGIKAVGLPCVEVHLSNPEAREAYRHESKIAPACIAKVSGFGGDSYLLALEGLVRWLRHQKP